MSLDVSSEPRMSTIGLFTTDTSSISKKPRPDFTVLLELTIESDMVMLFQFETRGLNVFVVFTSPAWQIHHLPKFRVHPASEGPAGENCLAEEVKVTT